MPQDVATAAQLVPAQYVASCRITLPHAVHCTAANYADWESETDALDGPGGPATIRKLAIDRAPNVCAIDEAGKIRCRFTEGELSTNEAWIAVSAPASVS